MKVGIGVGIPLGVFLIAFLLIFVVRRTRRLPEHQDQYSASQLGERREHTEEPGEIQEQGFDKTVGRGELESPVRQLHELPRLYHGT